MNALLFILGGNPFHRLLGYLLGDALANQVLGKRPLITAGMHLGEGTGAVAAIPLLDMKGVNARIEPGAIIREQVTIEKNARICQFRIMKNQPRLTFTKVEHLDGPDRGGFGSTGK